jgi:carbamoyl-phosphate synthase large subunit
LPKGGKAFLSVRNEDKAKSVEIARMLADLGFAIVATRGTAAAIEKAGLKVQPVNKVMEGRPHIVDMLKNREVSLIVNTVEEDQRSIRDPGRSATPRCRTASRTTRQWPERARPASECAA